MLNEYIKYAKCIPCKGYTEGCEEYEPNNTSGEESIYCSHFMKLKKEIKNMSSEEKENVKDNLGKLLSGNPGSNERIAHNHRPIEPSDIHAIITA